MESEKNRELKKKRKNGRLVGIIKRKNAYIYAYWRDYQKVLTVIMITDRDTYQ